MRAVRELTPKTEVGREAPVTARAYRPLTQGLDEFFENFLRGRWMEPFGGRRPLPVWSEMEREFDFPRIDVIDRDAQLVVRAELPGVKKEDLEITVTDDLLTLVATTRREEEEKTETFYRCETAHGKFERTIPLPVEVEGQKAEAILKDGILEVILPKRKAAKRYTVKAA